MIQRSYDWIINCITTSTNQFHLSGCSILINLFHVKFEDYEECDLLSRKLQETFIAKRKSIMEMES